MNGDLLDEIDENFTLNLSGAVNATISDGVGVGTITDDDGEPTLSIDDVTVTEGNSGHDQRHLHRHAHAGQRARRDASSTRPPTARASSPADYAADERHASPSRPARRRSR